MKTFDAVVIGAGIVGAACADRLAGEGMSVALVESRHIGAGVTAAGMGHIVVAGESGPQLALTRLSRRLWDELGGQLPDSGEYEKCGTIWVAETEEELVEASRMNDTYEHAGVGCRLLGPPALYDLEPAIRPGLAGGLLVEGDSVVYQLTAARFLAERAFSNGCRNFIGTGADSVDGNTVRLSNGDSISGGAVINAAGARAREISPELRIESRKGHLVVTDRYRGFLRHQIVELGYVKSAHETLGDSVAFNVQPRITGQVIIGSSRQPGESGNGIDRAIVSRMLKRAFEFMPGLREMSAIRIWTGIRQATPDNLPFIGRSTSNPHVITAAGHEGLGITTSLGTAELVADDVAGRDSRIPREPYSPARLEASNGKS